MSNNAFRICRIGILLLPAFFPVYVWADLPSPSRQNELLNLVRQDCGSCHGLTLNGGLGLPLTPQALEGKSSEALRDVILHGRDGTPMPPWNPFISEAEADWVVEMLMKGLPDAH